MYKITVRPLLVGVLIGLVLLYGLYIGFTIQIHHPDGQSIVSLIQSVDAYKSTLSGSFISQFFGILLHNYLLDLFYGLVSCLTLGLLALPSLFISGNTFGHVLKINHHFLNSLFVVLEIISMFIIVYMGANIGWNFIIKQEKIHFRKIGVVLLTVLFLLSIGALAETYTIRETLK